MLYVLTLSDHDQVWINKKEDSPIHWIVVSVKEICYSVNLTHLIMKYRKFLCVVVNIDSMYVIALKAYKSFAFRIIIKSISLYFLLYCDKNLSTFFYLYYYCCPFFHLYAGYWQLYTWNKYVTRVYSAVAVQYLQFVLHVMLFCLWNMFCTFTLALSVVCVQCPIWRFFL